MLSLTWSGRPAFGFTETSRTSSREQVAEGVTLEEINIRTAEGLLNIYIMTVDLTNPYVKLDTLVGTQGVITKNQSVSKMAKEAGAIGAVNGDFFEMDEGAPQGITVQAGQLVTSPAQRNDLYGFGLTKNNVPVFPVFAFQGTVTSPNGSVCQLFGLNKPSYLVDQGVSSDFNRLNMYTPRWGANSRGVVAGLTGMVEMVVENGQVREFRVDQPGAGIPQNGYILAGHGTAGQFLTANFQVSDQVQVDYRIIPETDNLLAAIGGQALLVENGQRRWFTQNINGKKARTAVGASQDGKTLYLVVTEGGNGSRGMTQEELADFMVSIGAWTAINLDGGGSSTMAARRLGDQTVSVVNIPVYVAERAVPTGIGIFSTAPQGAFAGIRVSGPKVIWVGSKRSFVAKGYDEHFNPFPVEQGNVSWDINPRIGEFQGGSFTATASGEGIIRATYNNIIKEHPVKVLGSSDISKIEVTPSSIAADPNESFSISVKVTTTQGAVYVLKTDEYELQVKGDIGTVSGNKFKAGDHLAAGELIIKIDSSTAVVKVGIGKTEKPFYGFETAKEIKFKDYPAGQVPGSFRLTNIDEPTFRGAGAARLEYDFTGITGTRAAYGNFTDGLTLPGQPLGLGLWVMGDGGNGHWLRARITDAGGTEKLLDFTKDVNWTGWRHVTADIPADLKLPVKLTDIYLVETEGGSQDKGVIYFDELSLISPPTANELAVKPPQALSGKVEVPPDSPVLLSLSPDINFNFHNTVVSAVYTVSAQQLWSTELPTPGCNPALPLYNIRGTANGAGVTQLPGLMKIQLKLKETTSPDKVQLMLWDEEKSVWQQIPCLVDAQAGTITGKTNRLGTFGVMLAARPSPVFTDTGSNWAKETISEMAAKKIVNGYPDGKFLPAKGVTRAEFVTLLAKTLGWSGEAADLKFKDAIPSWARESIAAAVARGVVRGYGDGTFQPKKVITRAEMAAMIDQSLGLTDSKQPSNYRDARAIPAWAVQSIRNTKVAGLMQGSSNRFRPGDPANRAEATAVMAKILEYYLK